MPSPRNVGVVIPAAGLGVRSGLDAPKQYREIAGVPLLLRTIRPFSSHPDVGHIAIALPPSDANDPPDWLLPLLGETMSVLAGGETRAHSVRNAVSGLPGDCSVVLVHDAARPFVARDVIDRLIACARRGVSCLAAIPMSDTVKRSDGNNVVLETVDRSNLWRAQTPQGFPRAILESVYRSPSCDFGNATDEAALVESAGHRVELITDDPGNLKLTLPSDFDLAEKLLK